MDRLAPGAFFDALDDLGTAGFWRAGEPVWAALGARLREVMDGAVRREIKGSVMPGATLFDGAIFVGEGAVIEPGAVIKAPVWIGPGAEIRAHAYLREHSWIGPGAVVGHCTEVKGSILLPGAVAPHFNYVGDSILGRDVNLGAGTILSNLKNVEGHVFVPVDGQPVDTGLRKFGAILGDGSKTGCNTVTNPGVIFGRRVVCYPNASIRAGLYPDGTIVKLRQDQPLDRLRAWPGSRR